MIALGSLASQGLSIGEIIVSSPVATIQSAPPVENKASVPSSELVAYKPKTFSKLSIS